MFNFCFVQIDTTNNELKQIDTTGDNATDQLNEDDNTQNQNDPTEDNKESPNSDSNSSNNNT